MKRDVECFLVIAIAVVATLNTSAAGQRSELTLPLKLNAFAVSTGGPRTDPVASQVNINITRWSTEAETARLLETLKSKGPEALLEAVRDAKSVGTISTPGNLAYDLRYAAQEELGDGMQRIVLMTDRPISMWEAVNRPRSYDYPFTFIELRLNQQGEGEGKLNLATRP